MDTDVVAALYSLVERTGGLDKRIDSMSDEMRQRFRAVIERLAHLDTT